MNEDIKKIFEQSSSVSMINGPRDSGKTDLFFRLSEDMVYEYEVIDLIASNTHTRGDPRVKYIGYMDRLIEWAKLPGRKIFGLDEMGVNFGRYDFMSKLSKRTLDVLQLARKFNIHVIGMAPASALVNKRLFETDIIDAVFYKPSKTRKDLVHVFNKVTGAKYKLKGVPRTSIKFITKDIASFGLKDPMKAKEKYDTLTRPQKAEQLYLVLRSQRKVAKIMKISHVMVKKLLDQRVKELALDVNLLT